MRYALTTYDDTEVTVACTFVGNDSVPRSYDVVVEDSLIATRTFKSQTAVPTVVEITVPFALTKGKTNIAVVIRARGGPTPALHKLRSIQDHNELDDVRLPQASLPAIAVTSQRSQNPFGVAR
jgi:ATP adenylyltransferase/5',5'''-P-1,P-4-tetraphosphate phosphorylase II